MNEPHLMDGMVVMPHDEFETLLERAAEQAVDRESAYEKLRGRAVAGAETAQTPGWAWGPRLGRSRWRCKPFGRVR